MSDDTLPCINVEYSHQKAVCTLTFHDSDSPQNVLHSRAISQLQQIVQELKTQPELKLLVVKSSKPGSFIAGADINELGAITSSLQASEISRQGQELFSAIENLSCQKLGIINGACLGGGMELALSLDYLIAVNSPKTLLALPETELGILPAWGGTVRLPKRVGPLVAIQTILQGKKYTAQTAHNIGLVDEVVQQDQFEQRIEELITPVAEQNRPLPKQKKWKTGGIAEWFINRTSFGRSMLFRSTQKRIAVQSRYYPALKAALGAIEAGYQSDQSGFAAEQAGLAEMIQTETCRNLVRLFLLRQKARNQGGSTQTPFSGVVGIIGGGVMGAGIAHVCAKRGLKVIVNEINDQALEAAKKRIDDTFQVLVGIGRLLPDQKQEFLSQITWTTDRTELKNAAIVIEAIPEILAAKQEIFAEVSQLVSPQTLLVTNTSALSVNRIAEAVSDPSRFAGLHFFNPVPRMELVELIRSESTSSETWNQLLSFCKVLGKTPVGVNDAPGFVVNRVLMAYLDQAVQIAVEMFATQQDPMQIDTEMRRFGMPMGPLELMDQVGIDVCAHVAKSIQQDTNSSFPTHTPIVLQRMVDQGWLGQKSRSGFYKQPKNRKAGLNEIAKLLSDLDLEVITPPNAEALSNQFTPIQQRLVLSLLNESQRCLDEHVVEDPELLDLAMVLGTGFAPFRGGPMRLTEVLGSSNVQSALETFASQGLPQLSPAEGFQQASSRVETS